MKDYDFELLLLEIKETLQNIQHSIEDISDRIKVLEDWKAFDSLEV